MKTYFASFPIVTDLSACMKQGRVVRYFDS